MMTHALAVFSPARTWSTVMYGNNSRQFLLARKRSMVLALPYSSCDNDLKPGRNNALG